MLRCNNHSMYAPPSKIPIPERIVMIGGSAGLSHEARMVRNSPTKPERRGKPMLAKAAKQKKPARRGICAAMPDSSAILRVRVRSYIMPTMKKSMLVVSP